MSCRYLTVFECEYCNNNVYLDENDEQNMAVCGKCERLMAPTGHINKTMGDFEEICECPDHDCPNVKSQGAFIGNLCVPCHTSSSLETCRWSKK